jgi:hypothetical protein
MEKLIQKKSWARRGASGLMGIKEPRGVTPAASRVRGGSRPAEPSASLTPAEQSALEHDASADIAVRSLTSQKVIVTGKLSGRSLDLVATLQNDGSLEVKGFNGTLPTELVSRQTGGTGVQIGGRRDGMSIQAVLFSRAEGGMALTERRGSETFISVGEAVAELHSRIVERLAVDLPRDAARLFQATLVYLALRCA